MRREVRKNMIEGYRLEKFESQRDLAALAEMYSEAFAAPPWNEANKCRGCGTFYGPDSMLLDACRAASCRGILVPAYPKYKTMAYIKREVKKPGSVARVVFNLSEQIAAAGWAFPFTRDAFVESKYALPESQRQLQEDLQKLNVPGKFMYISEVFVKEAERGNGLSNIVVESLIQAGRKRDQPLDPLMRTNWQSPMVAVAKRYGMEQVFGKAVQYDARVKRNLVTEVAVNGVMDPENADRVLYYIKPRLLTPKDRDAAYLEA